MSDYQYDGAVTIKLSHDNDEITVWPSVEAPGSVTIALLDSEEPRTNIGIATPAEWDAFVAAGNAALGRPPPVVVSAKAAELAESLAALPDAQVEEMVRNYRAAREAGPTVPRAEALAPDAEPLFYIWDTRSFVGDSILWWRPKSSGYTVNLDEAGTYTAAQCRGNRETDRPVPVEIARAVCSQHVIAGRLRRALEEVGGAPTTPTEKG